MTPRRPSLGALSAALMTCVVSWPAQARWARPAPPAPTPLPQTWRTGSAQVAWPHEPACRIISRALNIRCDQELRRCELREQLVARPAQACLASRWTLPSTRVGAYVQEPLAGCAPPRCHRWEAGDELLVVRLEHLHELTQLPPEGRGRWAAPQPSTFTRARYAGVARQRALARHALLRVRLDEASARRQLGVVPMQLQLSQPWWAHAELELRSLTSSQRLSAQPLGPGGLTLEAPPSWDQEQAQGLSARLTQERSTPWWGLSAEVGLWSATTASGTRWEPMGRAALDVVEARGTPAPLIPLGGSLAVEASARRLGLAAEAHHGWALAYGSAWTWAVHAGLAAQLAPDPTLYLRARVSAQRGPFGVALGRDLEDLQGRRGRWLLTGRLTF